MSSRTLSRDLRLGTYKSGRRRLWVLTQPNKLYYSTLIWTWQSCDLSKNVCMVSTLHYLLHPKRSLLITLPATGFRGSLVITLS